MKLDKRIMENILQEKFIVLIFVFVYYLNALIYIILD